MIHLRELVLTILHVHLNCWSIGGFAHPQVQVLALSCFEKKDVVAVVELSKFVELVELCFGIELDIFPAVRK